MPTRTEIISQAVNDCTKELYSLVQPSVSWDKFVEENQIYSKKYEEWEEYNKSKIRANENPDNWIKEQNNHPEWTNKSIVECIGPRPFEFYYLPKEIMKDVCDSYVHAYRLDQQQELTDTIEILKNYCNEPIVDKYIDDWTDETGFHHPGYRSYDHPDNLEKEVFKIIDKNIPLYQPSQKLVFELRDKFFEFLDMAGKFYNWNRDLNSFNISVYLGPSPNSNKQAVIDNWKKYRNKDIEINENQMKEDYYGEDY